MVNMMEGSRELEANQCPEVAVSVIVLNYKGRAYLFGCLRSVLASNFSDFELVLVDNASSDGSTDESIRRISDSRLRVVSSIHNLGYAGGNNLGAAHANGKYLVFLNFDTIVVPKWLDEIVLFMEDRPDVGIAQCSLHLIEDPRTFDNVGHYIDSIGLTYFLGRHEIDRGQYNTAREIFGAFGAALVARRGLFRQLGGFDADFFMFFEESDLCWRAWIAGYKVAFIPKAIVLHKGAVTYDSKREYDSARNAYYFTRNRLTALLKNYEFVNVLRLAPANILFMLGLSVMDLQKRKTREALAIVRGLYWNLRNFDKTARKREEVGRLRKNGDDFLMNRNIIRRFKMRRAVEKAQNMRVI